MSRLPVCTDTRGEPLKRLGHVTVRRVLDAPVELVGGASLSYASVYCSERGIGLVREGRTTQSAKFTLHTCQPHRAVALQGADGRDELIRRFLKLLRTTRNYAYPEGQEKNENIR